MIEHAVIFDRAAVGLLNGSLEIIHAREVSPPLREQCLKLADSILPGLGDIHLAGSLKGRLVFIGEGLAHELVKLIEKAGLPAVSAHEAISEGDHPQQSEAGGEEVHAEIGACHVGFLLFKLDHGPAVTGASGEAQAPASSERDAA